MPGKVIWKPPWHKWFGIYVQYLDPRLPSLHPSKLYFTAPTWSVLDIQNPDSWVRNVFELWLNFQSAGSSPLTF